MCFRLLSILKDNMKYVFYAIESWVKSIGEKEKLQKSTLSLSFSHFPLHGLHHIKSNCIWELEVSLRRYLVMKQAEKTFSTTCFHGFIS